MASFDEYISAGVRDGILPGAILYAIDKSGKFNYSNILSPNSPSHIAQLKPSSTLWLASATKLITTIGILQLVERGVVTLDEDVSSHIPILASQQVLTGFPSPDRKAQPRWQSLHKIPPLSGANVDERFAFPLLFQPGEGFSYGSAVDWAGRVLESLTGTSLQAYLDRHVFAPLGLTSFTFREARVLDDGSLWPLSVRDLAAGAARPYTGPHLNAGLDPGAALGGQGLYGRLDEYLEILRSLLVDDGRLLRPATAAHMFRPQLGGAARTALDRAMEDPSWAVGDFPATGEYDWGLGGLLIDGHAHGHRRKGALMWSGAANIFWWIDREAGVAGLFGTQIMPAAEPVTEQYIKAFEDEMYSRVEALTSESKLKTRL
ncbi:ML-236A carboxylate methylbutanoyltransferase mlcH like protein [Verticillium longisporum]|uniref:ML-236A carboxylate methylbutanoyltransferase mlcH like protein n=1 Tax=Verticillium longisporum TaxID=100787 RepID=A0A8I3ATY1_VERLO|nr:ML-236A carboxylate methylbutanoyltransferase mlcH like protein [Verticillium longisporum]